MSGKCVFLFGRFFSTLWENYKPAPDDEKSADRTEIGFFEDYVTHKLEKDDSSKDDSSKDCNNMLNNLKRREIHCVTKHTKLVREKDVSHLNPYFIIKVENNDLIEKDNLIPGHNEIWGDDIQKVARCFVKRNIIKMSHKDWEQVGFDKLLDKDLEGTIKAFQPAYDIWQIYHKEVKKQFKNRVEN